MRPPDVPAEARRELKLADAPEFFVDDWLFVKQIPLKAGEAAEQHVHEYDHVTMVAVGTVRVWVDGEDCGEAAAPKPLTILAGQKHMFLAVTDAVLYCIHNLRGEGYPAVRR